jgi:hypothetical protein
VEAQILEIQELELSGSIFRQHKFLQHIFPQHSQNRRPPGACFFSGLSRFASGPHRNALGTAPTPSAVVTMMVMMAVMPMMAMVPVMAPMMMVMMMPSPMDLGGLHLGTLLNRRSGAGIGQRQRLGALGWYGEHQQSADRSQSQKSHYVHVFSPLGSSCVTPAAWSIESSRAAAPIASYVGEVNVK